MNFTWKNSFIKCKVTIPNTSASPFNIIYPVNSRTVSVCTNCFAREMDKKANG